MVTKKNEEVDLPPNPRGVDFCKFEKQNNPQRCGSCDGSDVFDAILCSNLSNKWRLAMMDNELKSINQLLQAILVELRKKYKGVDNNDSPKSEQQNIG